MWRGVGRATPEPQMGNLAVQRLSNVASLFHCLSVEIKFYNQKQEEKKNLESNKKSSF